MWILLAWRELHYAPPQKKNKIKENKQKKEYSLFLAIVAATYFSEPQHALPLFLISKIFADVTCAIQFL